MTDMELNLYFDYLLFILN